MSATFIRALNESDSRLHKEQVIDKALVAAKLGNIPAQIFLALTRAAYDPMITWGVKQVPTTTGITDAPNPWSDFNALLTRLYTRKLTGNAARDAIAAMSQQFTSSDWNEFCVGVLKKDLRAGISEKTINKVCKGSEYEVSVFSCQLATSCEDRPEMRGVKRLEPKLDGVRVLMLCTIQPEEDIAAVVAYSRNGKVFDNFGHIEAEIAGAMNRLHGRTGYDSFILDGEIVGNSFQELMRQARRKTDVSADDSVFHVFDFIPLASFREGHWNPQLSKRLQVLEKMRPALADLPHIKLMSHLNVDLDTSLGREQFDRYCKDKVAEGYEGIMIKELGAPYECKRTTSWLKWKPTITVDLEVIDVEEGTGKNVGRMGALVCSGVDLGKTITVNVGSGFSDDNRTEFWSDRSVVVGRIAEVMADAVTQNQDGTYSLRFPRFVRFRDTLTGSKE